MENKTELLKETDNLLCPKANIKIWIKYSVDELKKR